MYNILYTKMGNYISLLTNSTKKYGWKRDNHDCRDFVHIFDVKFETNVDLSPLGPKEIYNQGNLGSCTANAIAYAYEFDEYKQKEEIKFIPSRLFIYYNDREIEGTVNEDSGAAIRDGVKSINKIGVCPETDWPYNISQFTQKPKYECYEIAKEHRSLQYKRVEQKIDQLKSALSNGFPIVFGFVVYESFESEETTKTGIVTMPEKRESILGGHAVCIIGYDDNKGTFKVRNSWGEKWGDKGYCYFPYKYILNSNLASDFWTITRIKD